MTIQLTQRWDCGSRDPFRSSGTWTPQAERMTWGGGDGAGEGEGKREGGVCVGGWGVVEAEGTLSEGSCLPLLPRSSPPGLREASYRRVTLLPTRGPPRPGPSQAV